MEPRLNPSALTSEAIFLTSTPYYHPKDSISFIFRDRRTGNLRTYWTKSRFAEGKLSSRRFRFKLTMHTSNKSFMVGPWKKYTGGHQTQSHAIQQTFTKGLQSLSGAARMGSSPFMQEELQAQSYGIPHNLILQRVTWAAEILKNGRGLRQWKHLVPLSVTLSFNSPQKTLGKTLGDWRGNHA